MAVPSAPTSPTALPVVEAALRREWLSHRLNRFLHAHLGLVLLAAFLPCLTPGEALARAAAWWWMHATLYAISLSALLLGWSSAQAEAEEQVWILGLPTGTAPWVLGKALGLALLSGLSTVALAGPALLAGSADGPVRNAALASAGVAVLCSLLGLALGFWVRDPVRGLIGTVTLWLVLLFGVDLLLLATAGAPLAQRHPDLWVLPLLLNPLDAFRLTILFTVEQAAFGALATGRLTGWWAAHAGPGLSGVLFAWAALAGWVAWRGVDRRRDL